MDERRMGMLIKVAWTVVAFAFFAGLASAVEVPDTENEPMQPRVVLVLLAGASTARPASSYVGPAATAMIKPGSFVGAVGGIRVSKLISPEFGYRICDFDYESDDDMKSLDLTLAGSGGGLTFHF